MADGATISIKLSGLSEALAAYGEINLGARRAMRDALRSTIRYARREGVNRLAARVGVAGKVIGGNSEWTRVRARLPALDGLEASLWVGYAPIAARYFKHAMAIRGVGVIAGGQIDRQGFEIARYRDKGRFYKRTGPERFPITRVRVPIESRALSVASQLEKLIADDLERTTEAAVVKEIYR